MKINCKNLLHENKRKKKLVGELLKLNLIKNENAF